MCIFDIFGEIWVFYFYENRWNWWVSKFCVLFPWHEWPHELSWSDSEGICDWLFAADHQLPTTTWVWPLFFVHLVHEKLVRMGELYSVQKWNCFQFSFYLVLTCDLTLPLNINISKFSKKNSLRCVGSNLMNILTMRWSSLQPTCSAIYCTGARYHHSFR